MVTSVDWTCGMSADVGYVILGLLAAMGFLALVTAIAFLGLVAQHHREERRGRQ